ncbi:hypothetical protein [Methylibium sp.]|uniref:hypothetical protein n=1 Tax=Methylibium sp. TaxID=2067992 RepID=UPI001822D96D|nr:hypothetical protein [Methylibium sp.]MBA3590474.1 ATP-binding protein [Methylibium sp.]
MSLDHALVLGITKSGKSTLLHWLAKLHHARGDGVLILDPRRDHGWPNDPTRVRFARDAEHVLDLAKRSQRCALFIDESARMLGRDARFDWLTTESRHQGHVAYLSALRATMVLPSLRAQCARAFVFRQSLSDARELADQFAEPRLIEAASLPRHQFIEVESCGGARRRMLTLPR